MLIVLASESNLRDTGVVLESYHEMQFSHADDVHIVAMFVGPLRGPIDFESWVNPASVSLLRGEPHVVKHV